MKIFKTQKNSNTLTGQNRTKHIKPENFLPCRPVSPSDHFPFISDELVDSNISKSKKEKEKTNYNKITNKEKIE